MAIAAWSVDEALAVARLRQWASDRCAVGAARTVVYQKRGWQARNTRSFDAKLVRMIDFGRVLQLLSPAEQVALILVYRDKERLPDVAKMLGCCTRTVDTVLRKARRDLAGHLGRLDLL